MAVEVGFQIHISVSNLSIGTKTDLFCFSLKVYNGTVADLRMVGVTLHQSSVIVANLYLALITAQWVSNKLVHATPMLLAREI